MNKHFVYVLRSKRDGRLYTGITNNLQRRLTEHNLGKTRSTSYRGPFALVYCEVVVDRPAARLREKFLKSGAGREFLKQHIPR